MQNWFLQYEIVYILLVQFNIHKIKFSREQIFHFNEMRKLSGCFWLFALKFWEVVEIYEWYFVIP